MKNYKFLIPVIVVFIIIVIIKLNMPLPTNWTASFSKSDKIPFGSYILFDLLPDIFPGQIIETSDLPLYNTFKNKNVDNTNIIIICNSFNPDELDTRILFSLIEKGNNVFIAANSFGKNISDSLNIMTNYHNDFLDDTIVVDFTNPKLKLENGYTFTRANYSYYFNTFDTSKAIVLGINDIALTNYLQFNYGKGKLFLHALPLAFTNYNILKSNRDYIFKSLSYLPVKKVIWDEYYKESNQYYSSPIRYILGQPSLKWAYYTILFSIILFVIFKGKRNQRIIPVIKPLENTTMEFIRTIGNLYFKQKNHKNIADKKIIYFLDYVRSRYMLRTNELNIELIDKLSEKSHVNKEIISNIISAIRSVNKAIEVKQETLLELNKLLETFYSKTGAYGK